MIKTEFVTETRPYNVDGYADAEGATDIEFYNAGATLVTINNRPLEPQAAWHINGFPFEINTTRYIFAFTGGAGALIVTRRTYRNKKGL